MFNYFWRKKSLAYPIMLACLKSKITYVPLNSDTPNYRINKILEITKSQLFISVSNKSIKIKKIKFFKINDFNFLKKSNFLKRNHNRNNNIAYIIFTSGSTGNPKGVKISYKALDYYCNWLKKKFKVFKKKCSQFSEISFDLSVVDIYGTLISGGTICSVENDFYKKFPGKFIFDKKINYSVFVPSVIDLMHKGNNLSNKYLSSLKKIFFCGEPLKKSQLDLIFKAKKNIKILNSYGPTEFTVSCSQIELSKKNYNKYCKRFVSIGKPIAGTVFKIFKSKKKFNKQKQGILLLNGKQLFDGYISSEKIEDRVLKYNSKKFYNTVDIVQKIKNNFYFIKRDDSQIKKNGFRIELDEIDNLIQGKIKTDFCKSFFKFSKINLEIKSKKSKKFILKKLEKYLPHYMIPDKIIFIKSVPLNKNFKIDNKKIYKSIT